MNSSESPTRRALLQSVRRRSALFALTLTLMAVSAAATAGYAWLVGPALQALQEQGFSHIFLSLGVQTETEISLSLGAIASMLVLLAGARALSETLRSRWATRAQLGVVRELRATLLAHALALPARLRQQWTHGELASRIQLEVQGVRSLLYLGFSYGLRNLLMAASLATVALQVDSQLAIPGLLAMPLVLVAMVTLGQPIRRLQRDLAAAETRVVSTTTEAIDGTAVLIAHDAGPWIRRRIDEAVEDSMEHAVRAQTWQGAIGPLVELGGALAIGTAIALAARTRTDLDLASTATVLSSLVLLYRPLQGLAHAAFGFWAGLGSLDRLDELLRLPTEAQSSEAQRSAATPSLELNSLSFAYEGRAVLSGLTASFRPSELVVLVGVSGAGKSTLLKLLAGVLDDPAGAIRLNAQSASQSQLRSASAWMPQEPVLFHDTVLQNIALGDPEPDRARVIAVARRVDADEFIELRPNGYDGLLAEGGTDLSVGQRQRIALARALYRETPILLLDEPTAALDSEQERRVLQICRAHADAGGIVLAASHRSEWIRHADRVLELRDGRLHAWKYADSQALHSLH
jgi:subfamily B ATP-binding cassette protein MsbA